MQYRFSIIVPKSLNMTPGKVASQVGHVVQIATEKLRNTAEWKKYREHPAKYVLAAADMEALYSAMYVAEHKKLFVQVFMDSPPTTQGTDFVITAVAIFGPEKKVKDATAELELY